MEQEKKKRTPANRWEDCLHWAEEKDIDFNERCKERGLELTQFSLHKIAALPVYDARSKTELFSKLTVPLSSVARLIGRTTYLEEELAQWGENSAEWLAACGINWTTVLLVADGFDKDGPAWGMIEGAKTLKALTVGMSERPWEDVVAYGANACVLTVDLREKWMASGRSAGPCRMLFCLSNDLSDRRRKEWQEKLEVPIYRQLGLAGVQSSAIAWESLCQTGYHFNLDCFWPEIVDLSTETVLPAHKEGALILTAMDRRSTTAIRLVTGWKGAFKKGTSSCEIKWPQFMLSEI